MPALAGLRESALRTASRAYRQTSRARRPCIGADRGNPGKSPQRCKAPQKLLRERRTRVGRSRRACRTPAALPIAARGRTCPKGPENGLGAGSCADASARSAMRHRRRRRKGGGDVREPQGDDVVQAGRDHEAQEQGAARAADDRAGRDAVRRRHPPEGEMRGGRFRGKLWALFLDEAPCRFGTLRQAGRRCGCRAGMGEEVSAVQTTQLTAN